MTTGFKSTDRHGSVGSFLEVLRARHLADRELREVRRALQALSTRYVEQRAGLACGRALSTAGKRAAYALFYGPLHLLTVDAIVRELGAHSAPPRRIVDLGCGTGAAGAAWALACQPSPPIEGLDIHPWAAAEARWTLRALGLTGRIRRGPLVRPPRLQPGDGVIAAWAVNELDPPTRDHLRDWLVDAASRHPVLVIEPIARSATPWWPTWETALAEHGARSDEWRLTCARPPLIEELDRAAGLDHRTLKARSLWVRR